jgi:glycerol-3-phosphate dehydrogenase
MNRASSLQNLLADGKMWDIAVIGGGCTGVGIALDAASRGYSVCLLEQNDFGKGASSRSTKLIHGGVRYLQRGNLKLVIESLKERGILRQNAPHLVHDLAFVVPNYAWWEAPFYGIGLKLYDKLAGRYGFGKSRVLSKEDALQHIPTLQQSGLRGGVLYFDGQFDDARLLISLAQTAEDNGAVLVNYAPVTGIRHDERGRVRGVAFTDLESGLTHSISARAVINATGAFSDSVRKLDEPTAANMIAPSQGVHVVLDRSFLPGDAAIMVPRTRDGRVMFAIPWHEHTLLGTTDTAIENIALDPLPMDQEIDFILETAGHYLQKRPARSDILSVFAGIRPLVKDADSKNTSALSRDYAIQVADSCLISIAGGKWTTYRKMAEVCVDRAAAVAGLDDRPCITKELRIHGFHENDRSLGDLIAYGSDAAAIRDLIRENAALANGLHPSLPDCAAQVVWAVRNEMARTVDDVLARRIRALFLNARAAVEMAPNVARLMAKELGRDESWQREQVAKFTAIALGYSVAAE